MPAITASVKPPRLVGVGFPPGRPFGAPGDADTQRRVLRAALEALPAMTKPGTRVDLDVEYPGPRGRIHPAQPPPIAQLIKRKPWLLWRLVSGRLPHGA
jgi:hypothetical protein